MDDHQRLNDLILICIHRYYEQKSTEHGIIQRKEQKNNNEI